MPSFPVLCPPRERRPAMRRGRSAMPRAACCGAAALPLRQCWRGPLTVSDSSRKLPSPLLACVWPGLCRRTPMLPAASNSSKRSIMRKRLLLTSAAVLIAGLGFIATDITGCIGHLGLLNKESASKLAALARAVDSLSERREAALAVVSAALGDEDPHIRARAAETLVELGAAGVPALSENLTNPSGRARRAAAHALC